MKESDKVKTITIRIDDDTHDLIKKAASGHIGRTVIIKG
jgi:uncharacterized protein (DUF1778 family)